MKLYEVGGCVRDRFLGVKSKDIDFTFVLDDKDISTLTVAEGFKRMKDYMLEEGYTIFLSVEEMHTIRAKFPKTHVHSGLDADFVLARKEVGYIPGTRRPILELGTLYDDLFRRDFTVNAMAEDEEGNLIDPFNGRDALKHKLLVTPNNVEITFGEDPLRILRAIRFSITKGFRIEAGMWDIIENYDYDKFMGVVSTERIREELYKCLAFNTISTLSLLSKFPKLTKYIFEDGGLWLKPTTEKR